jgi:hypothetical protein
MADNKIKVKQLDKEGLSGYIGEVYAGTLSGKSTHLNPSESGVYDLGQASLAWKTVYADSISVSGSNEIVDRLYAATGNLLPIRSGYDLGSIDRSWENLYLDKGHKIGIQDGVFSITAPGSSTSVKMAQGPIGNRGGFGGDSSLYYYDHQTGSSQTYPATGYFTFDSTGDFNQANNLYVHDYGYYSQTGAFTLVDNTPWITDLANSSSDVRGTLRLFKNDNPSKFSSYHVTGVLSNGDGYFTVPLSYVSSSESNNLITGAFAENDKVVLSFSARGDKGQVGPQGPSDGPQGAQGQGGPQGPQGPQGLIGPAGGPQGPQGTSIGWSGTWNSLISYNDQDAVFHGSSSFISSFGNQHQGQIPRGTQDDQYWDILASGVTGPQGPQGPEGGPPGSTGPQGGQGPQGAQGLVGALGIISGSTSLVTKTIQQNDFWIGENAFGVIDALRYNGTEYTKSRANSQENAEVVGLVQSLDTGNNSFTVVTEGFISWPTGLMKTSPFASHTTDAQFSPGKIYWLDDSVAGLLTTGEPNTVGSVSKPLFCATSTTGGFVQNYRGQVVESGIGPNFIIPGIGDVTRNGQQTLTSKKLSLQTSFGVKALNWNNGQVSIDFDGEPFQTLDVLGSTIIKTINGGTGKTVTLKIKNTTVIDYALIFGETSDKPIFVGSLAPTELKAGKNALVSFTSFGANQSDTIIAFGDEK